MLVIILTTNPNVRKLFFFLCSLRIHSAWHQALESQLPDSGDVKMLQYFLVLAYSCAPNRLADISGGEGGRGLSGKIVLMTALL